MDNNTPQPGDDDFVLGAANAKPEAVMASKADPVSAVSAADDDTLVPDGGSIPGTDGRVKRSVPMPGVEPGHRQWKFRARTLNFH